MHVVLTSRAHQQLAKLPQSAKKTFTAAVDRCTAGDTTGLSSLHATKQAGMVFLKAGNARALGKYRDNKTLVLISVHAAADLRRVVRSLPEDVVESHEFKTIKAHGRVYLENPPRKLKRPRVNAKWRNTLNKLCGEKGRDLRVTYILKRGAESWFDLLKRFLY